MRRDQQPSPLPEDPPRREDVMRPQPRDEDAAPGSPLPDDPAVREDIIEDESQDPRA